MWGGWHAKFTPGLFCLMSSSCQPWGWFFQQVIWAEVPQTHSPYPALHGHPAKPHNSMVMVCPFRARPCAGSWDARGAVQNWRCPLGLLGLKGEGDESNDHPDCGEAQSPEERGGGGGVSEGAQCGQTLEVG